MADVRVALLPSQIDPAALPGSVAVVIDILRASTTIIHALAAGAQAVIPCSELQQATDIAAGLGPEIALRGGERGGRLIEGFDLDNSPFSYTPETVAGRVIVFTTTNGTRALAAAAGADRILIGAFVNLQAIVDELQNDGRPVWLVCAGTDGEITEEDVLFAGAIAAKLLNGQPGTESTRAAIQACEQGGRTDADRLRTMQNSHGGRNLIEIGQSEDIARAAELNRSAIVPEWNRETGRITIAGAL